MCSYPSPPLLPISTTTTRFFHTFNPSNCKFFNLRIQGSFLFAHTPRSPEYHVHSYKPVPYSDTDTVILVGYIDIPPPHLHPIPHIQNTKDFLQTENTLFVRSLILEYKGVSFSHKYSQI